MTEQELYPYGKGSQIAFDYKEYRFVAYILPEMDGWGLGQVDESDFPRIATKLQIDHPRLGYVFCAVGPPRGNPDGRMIYEYHVKLKESAETMEKWRKTISLYLEALDKGPLFREDFTNIFEH